MVRKILSFILCSLFFVLLLVSSSYAVSVYPNPWIPDSNRKDNDGKSIHGTLAEGISFTGLSSNGGTIYIYNATGELVRKVKWTLGNSAANWDGRNERHEYVASGVYIWVVKDGGTKSGKIVIIR